MADQAGWDWGDRLDLSPLLEKIREHQPTGTWAECVKTVVRALRQAPANAKVQPPLLPYLPDFEALRDDPDFISLTRPTSPGGPKPEDATTAH